MKLPDPAAGEPSPSSIRRSLLKLLFCGGVARHRRKPNISSSPKPIRLSDLLNIPSDDDDCVEIESRELQSVVTRVATGDLESAAAAADEMRWMAKNDPKIRETLAVFGAIPPLICMLDSGDLQAQISALYALLNISVAHFANKSAIIAAGILPKLTDLISQSEPQYLPPIVALFLTLTAHGPNSIIICTYTPIVTYLITAFRYATLSQSKHDAIRAIFNLSLPAANIHALVAAGIVPAALSAARDRDTGDWALSVLVNTAASPEGVRAVRKEAGGVAQIVEMLTWSEAPEIQEKAAYLLTAMSYKSTADRAAMAAAGAEAALLELALVGSAIAQRRAARLLGVLRGGGERWRAAEGVAGGGRAAMSAPVVGREGEGGEERRAVKEMVRESLQSNMRRIVRRAKVVGRDSERADLCHLITMLSTSSSNSLPF